MFLSPIDISSVDPSNYLYKNMSLVTWQKTTTSLYGKGSLKSPSTSPFRHSFRAPCWPRSNPEQPRGGPDSFREQVHGGIPRLGGCTLKNHRRNTSSETAPLCIAKSLGFLLLSAANKFVTAPPPASHCIRQYQNS